MIDDQKKMWLDYSERISVDHILQSYHKPTSFQREFNVLLKDTVIDNGFSSGIEIGCEAGISLMLLNPVLEKSTFFDYDHTILEKVESAAAILKLKDVGFICDDMFIMASIEDESYDLVYNSGVIEHYTKEVRAKAIKSYARIAKKGGYVIVAYPNHHSLPYRLSYLIGNMMGKKTWPWPKEYKYYSLQDEMKEAGLVYIDRVTMDRHTIFNQWITKYKLTRAFFLFLDKFLKFEGYLTVCIAKKPH